MFKPEDISKLQEIRAKLENQEPETEEIDEEALNTELTDMREKRAERYTANWKGKTIKVVDFFDEVVIPKLEKEGPSVTIDKAVLAANSKSTARKAKTLVERTNNGTIDIMKSPDITPRGGEENNVEKEAILKSIEFNTTTWRAKLTEELSKATGQEARNASEIRLKIFETDPYRWISDAFKVNKQNFERELEEDPKESTKNKIQEALNGIKEYEENLQKADKLQLELPIQKIYYDDFKLNINDEFLHTKNEKLVEKLNKEFKEKEENNYKVTRLFRRNQKLFAEMQTENPASKAKQITIPKLQHLIKEIKEQEKINEENTKTQEKGERNVEEIMNEFIIVFKKYKETNDAHQALLEKHEKTKQELATMLARKKELEELIAKDKEEKSSLIPEEMKVKNGKIQVRLLTEILEKEGVKVLITKELGDKLLRADGTLGVMVLKKEFKLNTDQVANILYEYKIKSRK